MQITILFYGAFRRFGSSVILDTPKTTPTVNDLRPLLVRELGKANEALVYDSVFANDIAILDDSTIITTACSLSVLPPVCGG